MKPRRWDWLVFAIFGCFVFIHFHGLDSAPEMGMPASEILSFFDSARALPHDENQLLLFIFDFQDFSCMTCLDSFLALHRILPLGFKTSKTWGILVANDQAGDEYRIFRIAEKKLKGFVRANHIAFPILVGKTRIFGDWAEKGSCVLLFDSAKRVLCRYEFPLTSGQMEEIFLNLRE